MVYQLYEISDSYFEANERTDIKFSNELRFPKMTLSFMVFHNEFITKNLYSELFKNSPKHDNHNWAAIHYKLKYVLTKNSKDFRYITGIDTISIKCNIISKKIKFKCSNIIEYMKISLTGQIFMYYQFFDASDENSNNLTTFDHVEIDFYDGDFSTYFAFFQLYDESILSNYVLTQAFSIPLIFYNKNILVIEINIMREQKNCVNKKQDLYSDTQTDRSIIDCYNNEMNQTFSCSPVMQSFLMIQWERDLNYFKYNICPINVTNDRFFYH